MARGAESQEHLNFTGNLHISHSLSWRNIGKEAGLGDPMRAGSRPVRGESRRNRLEIEAKLVHRRQERPYYPA